MLPRIPLPVLAFLLPLMPGVMAAPSPIAGTDNLANAAVNVNAHTHPGGEAHLAPLVYARQAAAAPMDVCEEWGEEEYDDEEEEGEEEVGVPISAPAPPPAPAPGPVGEGSGGATGSCAHGEWRCTGSALEMCHYVDTTTLGWVKLHDCPTSCTVGASIQCV